MTEIIVFGNEKGGSGKSTTAMHVMIALLLEKKKIGVIDLDIRQKTIFRYLENRQEYSKNNSLNLLFPYKYSVESSREDSKELATQDENQKLASAVTELKKKCDFILIDCPGANTNYSIAAHRMADLLITPINDSLIDFDLLGRVDVKHKKIRKASIYSEMVWNARKHRIGSNLPSMKWLVLRNRMSHLKSRNRQQLDVSVLELSKRLGFKIVPGFSERTIFRELFLSGLTLLDLENTKDWKFTISHIAARNEIRSLMSALSLY